MCKVREQTDYKTAFRQNYSGWREKQQQPKVFLVYKVEIFAMCIFYTLYLHLKCALIFNTSQKLVHNISCYLFIYLLFGFHLLHHLIYPITIIIIIIYIIYPLSFLHLRHLHPHHRPHYCLVNFPFCSSKNSQVIRIHNHSVNNNIYLK